MLGISPHTSPAITSTIPAHFDIALRDLGLVLGAFALARLSVDYGEI